MRNRYPALLFLFAPAIVSGQSKSELQQILERLQALEEQNRALVAEVRALRQELRTSQAPPAAAEPAAVPIAERLAVQEKRTEELAQSKVETEHRHPIQLTGMLLFNAFLNGKYGGDASHPVIAVPAAGPAVGGATVRQSVLGLKFQGPSIFGGGKVGGSLFMDLFAGTGTSLNQAMRIRVASLDLSWKRTTVSFAHDKPILSPREPTSLAQVGVSPLTQSGNLWLWQPQFRVEQRFHFGEKAGLRAQGGIYQTNEPVSTVPPEYLSTLSRARPGLQGRFELWKDFGAGARLEIAPGFHVSNTHVEGKSLPARVYAVDWLLRPMARFDFTGQFFAGENTNVISGLRPGITFFPNGAVKTVHGIGGWGQLTFRATRRATFNFYGGQQDNRAADLLKGAINKNQTYAGNVIYRLGENVFASFEAYQVRTTYIASGTRLVPHYDLALAYLF